MQTDDSDGPQVFLNRCANHMGQQIPKVWIFGAAWLFAHPDSYVFNTGFALTKAGIADNPCSDIALVDDHFLVIAEELIG